MCQRPVRKAQRAGHGTSAAAPATPAAKAYVAAMDRMHGPMMQAAQESDPDVAFVKGMIPHHQGAIEMPKVVLQFGKDEQAKKWANDVIRLPSSDRVGRQVAR